MSNWNIEEQTRKKYLDCCLEAFNNENVFNNFKKDERYVPILEHVSYENSLSLIEEMLDFRSVITEEDLKKIKQNDDIGNSSKFVYDYFGEISPSTIRYIKNSLDIKRKFNFEKLNTVVEIGGGYGGLCKVLYDLFLIESYTIIDLYEPTLLSKKYLSCFNINVNTLTPSDNLNFTNKIDLVISNYSFSELNKELQEIYMNNVIKFSNNFYIIYNNICRNNYSCEEFIDKIKNICPNINVDVINDFENNKILYGYY